MPRSSKAREDDAHQETRPVREPANQRRAKILHAASRVISRRGVDHARFIDIADEAEVSVGMIQHYFRSRSNLISETFSWKLDESLASYEATIHGSRTAWEDVEALCEILTREPFEEINSQWLEFFSICNRDPKFASLGSDLWARWVGHVRSIIEKGIKNGEFKPQVPAEDVAARFVSLADGLGIRVLIHHSDISVDRMFQLLIEGAARELGVDLAEVCSEAASRKLMGSDSGQHGRHL